MAAPPSPLDGLPDLERLTRYDEALRQVPADRPALERAAALAFSRLDEMRAAGDCRAELALLGYLGNAYRVLGRTDEAAALHGEAVALARRLGDGRGEAANLIRQGEAVRYGGDPAAAEPLYRAALARVTADASLANLEDFALQHLGKCRLEHGDVEEAVACFARALEIRRGKDDPALIASTEAALCLARESATARDAGRSGVVGAGPDVGVVDEKTEEAPGEKSPEPPGERAPG